MGIPPFSAEPNHSAQLCITSVFQITPDLTAWSYDLSADAVDFPGVRLRMCRRRPLQGVT